MKLILFFVLVLLTVTSVAQEDDTAKQGKIQRDLVKKMDDEDKMRYKVMRDAEDEEKRNPAHRLDSAARAQHEARFKKRGSKPN